MSKESTTWDFFRSKKTMNTSWWQLIMSPSGLKPCHAKLLMQRTPRRCLKRQYLQDSEFQERWLVMKELTSLTRIFTITCQNMGSIIMLLLHITRRQVAKQKHQTNKSRTFYKRWSMRWELHRRIPVVPMELESSPEDRSCLSTVCYLRLYPLY